MSRSLSCHLSWRLVNGNWNFSTWWELCVYAPNYRKYYVAFGELWHINIDPYDDNSSGSNRKTSTKYYTTNDVLIVKSWTNDSPNRWYSVVCSFPFLPSLYNTRFKSTQHTREMLYEYWHDAAYSIQDDDDATHKISLTVSPLISRILNPFYRFARQDRERERQKKLKNKQKERKSKLDLLPDQSISLLSLLWNFERW